MPFTVKSVHTRPSLDVEFFPTSSEVLDFRTTLEEEGKILFSNFVLSDDLLVKTGTMVFKDKESKLEFSTSEVMMNYKALRKAYNDERGITITFSYSEN